MKKESVFDTFTEKYDAWYNSKDGKSLYESEILCLKALIKNPSTPILEIGVGTGRFSMWFKGAIGIDPALHALRFAKKRGTHVVQANGENVPFRDETFGCIMLIVTMCFLQNPVTVLKEANRVLKENGALIIGFIQKDSSWGRFYEEKKRKGHPLYIEAKFYTLDDIERLLKITGLRISQIKSTLLRNPDMPAEIESPFDGYYNNAGFVCMEVKRVN